MKAVSASRHVRTTRRVLATLVLVALTACSSGGSQSPVAERSDTIEPPADDTGGAAPSALVVDGRITDTAVDAVFRDGDTPDAGALADLQAALLALPETERLGVLNELAGRVEQEAASIWSVGADRSTLDLAWSTVAAQLSSPDDPVFAPPATSGLRRTASPSASSVGVVGVMMAMLGLGVTADATVSAANGLKPGEVSAADPSSGTKVSGSLGESAIGMEFNGTQDGVAVTFKASATVHPCPDPSGNFDLSINVDLTTSKGGAGNHSTIDIDVTGRVGDDAELAEKNIDSRTQWADYGGGTNQFLDFGFSGASGLEGFALNRSGGKVTEGFAKLSVIMSAMFVALVSDYYLKAAEKAWKSGRCVDLTPTAAPGPTGLEPSSSSEISADPKSKLDGQPTGGTVTALLSAGGDSVSPSSTPLAAPATFTYVAPGERDQSGTVSLEARSRRGVGRGSITLDTKAAQAYLIVGGLQDWQVSQTVCDIMVPFTFTTSIGTMNLSGGLTGTYEATGELFAYTGTYAFDFPNGTDQPGTLVGGGSGVIAGQPGSGDESYTVTPVDSC